MEKIDAIILAGGLGTRLKGTVSGLPKALAPVGGKPFLDILLRFLDRSGIVGKAILAVGYMSDKIVERYRDAGSFGFEIVFSVEKELLGTGGAVKLALMNSESENVLVLNGDSYVEADLGEMAAAHAERRASLTMVVKEVEDASRYGRVRMDSCLRVVSFEEKRPGLGGGYINAGIYLLRRSLFDGVEGGKVLSMERDLLPAFLDDAVYGFVSRGRFIDIGIPETYFQAGEYLKGIDP
ncbi:MAG: nucleotidyltransferase family protein [Deltaproteobacteria bacterium]|nr:nucleotidyltransferase family protein [Deltaproteobacteria bacterium]